MKEDINYGRAAALEFLGENTRIRHSFLADMGQQMSAELVADLFQIFSGLVIQIFIGIASAYSFYLIHGRRQDKKSREKLETKIKEILREHRAELYRRFNILEKRFSQRKDKTNRDEVRMNTYSLRAKQLMNPEETIDEIVKIMETEFKQAPRRPKTIWNSLGNT